MSFTFEICEKKKIHQGYLEIQLFFERAKFKMVSSRRLIFYCIRTVGIIFENIQLCAFFHTINHLYVIDYNINLSKIRCIESYIIHSVYSRKLNDLWYSYIFSWIILTHIAIRLIYMQSINKIIMFCAHFFVASLIWMRIGWYD